MFNYKGKILKVLVLGSTGLIGRTFLRVLSEKSSLDVYGTVRSKLSLQYFKDISLSKIFTEIDIEDDSKMLDIFGNIQPDVVINCIGATKHKEDGNHPIKAIKLNALFPHRVAQLSSLFGAKFIHVSTDCVFSGKKGFYTENDQPDADDFYGKSKALGEVLYGDALTIRTSTIGHELNTNYGLLNWFLSQENRCKGFKNAVFSGLPTVALAQVVRDYILGNKDLKGLYHIAASPINKYDLLRLVAKVYGKKIEIELDEDFVVDRSLDATKFNLATGFKCPEWPQLIETMHQYK
jgi:dTDP-4-dehydrorhamnose reductase